jgi:hypothetical protein
MWGHYRENSFMYKRTPSRDNSNMEEDVEENLGISSLNIYKCTSGYVTSINQFLCCEILHLT